MQDDDHINVRRQASLCLTIIELRSEMSLTIVCCCHRAPKCFGQWIFWLTPWLQCSGGSVPAQLQPKPLAEAEWLTECVARLRLATETSWSVSTSPRQSGDCYTAKSMLSICPDSHPLIFIFCKNINLFPPPLACFLSTVVQIYHDGFCLFFWTEWFRSCLGFLPLSDPELLRFRASVISIWFTHVIFWCSFL